MRKRFQVVLLANGQWPDAQTGGIGFQFNWVKVDNRGTGKVDLGLSPLQVQADLVAGLMTVSGGKVRVFNLGGAKRPDGTWPDDVPDQVYLKADNSGTTVVLEVADEPIVDLVSAT